MARRRRGGAHARLTGGAAGLEAIALVAHDERRVELWRRQGATWTLHVARGGDRVALAALGLDLAVDELLGPPLAP